jgi:hypothetical protein
MSRLVLWARCREERQQGVNKRRAFERLAKSDKFQTWVRLVVAEIRLGKTLDERVDEEMQPKFLKVEVRNADGKWVEDEYARY